MPSGSAPASTAPIVAIPQAIGHYRTHTIRLISDMTWGRGSLLVGGGTAPMLALLGAAMGASLGVQAFSTLDMLGMGPVTGMISAFALVVSYFSGPMLNFGDFSRYARTFGEVKKGNFWGLPVNFLFFSILVVCTVSAAVTVIGKDDEGKNVADLFTVKKGDKVLISKYGGTEVKIDGESYLIMREDDILGIIG